MPGAASHLGWGPQPPPGTPVDAWGAPAEASPPSPHAVRNARAEAVPPPRRQEQSPPFSGGDGGRCASAPRRRSTAAYVLGVNNECMRLQCCAGEGGDASPSRGGIAVNWSTLGLADSPDTRGDQTAILRWRLHTLCPRSDLGDFISGARNSCRAQAAMEGGPPPPGVALRTGIAEWELTLQRGSVLHVVLPANSSSRSLCQLHVAGKYWVCMQHRLPVSGLRCLCPSAMDDISANTARSGGGGSPTRASAPLLTLQAQSPQDYAAKWRGPIELDAAASSVEDGGGRILFDVRIDWTTKQMSEGESKFVGFFQVPAALLRVHKVKFRSVIPGGEHASSWLCIRRPGREDGTLLWSGHGGVLRAWYAEGEKEIILTEDDDVLLEIGESNISVMFEVVESSHDALPANGMYMVETIPKALASSCMAMALAELPQAALARGTVLGADDLPWDDVTPDVHDDIAVRSLNVSQQKAVLAALAQPISLVQGPPGTGKTRTTASLATLLARCNLASGENRAVLFCAPTNRAADCALLFVARLGAERAREQLRSRLEEDGHTCAICLRPGPDAVTACNHVFHKECLAQALKASSRCPMCRRGVKHADSGMRVLRIYGADAEKQDFPVPRRHDHPGMETHRSYQVPPEIRPYAWHWRCHGAVEGEIPSPEAAAAGRAYRAMLEYGTYGAQAETLRRTYFDALAEARAAELRDADIVFATCVSCRRMAVVEALAAEGAPKFQQVIIDEAGQATEPEALTPMTFASAATKVCLFGDHQQLRPVLKSSEAQVGGMGISLFERLAEGGTGAPLHFLALQYRMHPEISAFPSQHFYGGRVRDDESVQRHPPSLLRHPRDEGRAMGIMAWDMTDMAYRGGEQVKAVRTTDSGTGSRSHAAEAEEAAELAKSLAAIAGEGSVGVLSWYKAQVTLITSLLAGRTEIHIGTIATAQGSEWDYVVLSTVRRGGGNRLGLLSDEHVLDVALTRARLGMVVLGSEATLSRDQSWAAFWEHCRARGARVEARPLVGGDPRAEEAAWARCLRPGLQVSLRGLQARPELNGVTGIVASHAPNDQGRWEVAVRMNGELCRLSLKAANMQLAHGGGAGAGLGDFPQRAASSVGVKGSRRSSAPGLNALVASQRPGGQVEFSKFFNVRCAEFQVIEGAPLRQGGRGGGGSRAGGGGSRTLGHGARVRLVGLVAEASRYNGLIGVVRGDRPEANGTWRVEVTKAFAMSAGSVEAHLTPKGLHVTSVADAASEDSLPLDTVVVLHGLRSKSEYNGEWGAITSAAPTAEGRWEVEVLYSGEPKRLLLKRENLAPEVRA